MFRSVPSERGFSQPCPLWQGQCTIYSSPHYPHFCRTYKCKLLKKVLDETTSLPDALTSIQQAKEMIYELEPRLPVSPHANFRERLVTHLEALDQGSSGEDADLDLQQKAETLLLFYEQVFGVNDLVEKSDAE